MDLCKVCEKLLPFVSKELIGDKYIKKLKSFVNLLPQRFVSKSIILECPLTGEEKWGDISFQVDLSNGIQELSALPASWQKNSAWIKLIEFANKKSLKSFKKIWTEFDVGSSFSSPPTPSIFLKTPKIAQVRKIAPFFGISKHTLSLLEQCTAALPNGLRIGHLGFMLSRPSDTCRINIYGRKMSGSKVSDYFKRIEIPPTQTLISLVQAVEEWRGNIMIDLDISGGQLAQKIGFEFLAPSHRREEKIWEQCFDLLSQVCSFDIKKKIASLAWHGKTMEFITGTKPLFLTLLRGISHIKCIHTPASGLQAKIYLGANLIATPDLCLF